MKNFLPTFVFAFFFSFSLMEAEPLSKEWTDPWQNPPASARPLQMVHGRDLTDQAAAVYYRDECGLGGVVINVGGDGYIRRPENWKRFADGARNAADAGLRIWIYDEEGYPSLGAGGVVLEENPELVSKELVWDKDAEQPFTVRDCYEFTHSCNNYSCCRRYPNPLEPESTQKFLKITHARYKAELGDELYNKIEAFFTDEPSMMAANLGQIPEEARRRVPTVDPINPDKKNLPMLPWCSDLEEKYRERYGEELSPHFLSLFTGDAGEDKEIRSRYWRLISDLYAERYFGAIRNWCRANGAPLSSGHTLHEEILRGHVPLDGNKMKTLKTLDLPGLDELNSDPGVVNFAAWTAAAFPCSAARLIGSRRVMSEISDFGQVNSGEKRPVTLDWMEAATAWETAWGVTDFMLYYAINPANADYRNEATHKAYSEFVGRLNSILMKAEPIRPVLLYYPIELMQREFKPTADCVNHTLQSEPMETAINSFIAAGDGLQRAGIPFSLIDGDSILELCDETLAKQTEIIFPEGVVPPPEVMEKLRNVWKLDSDNDKRIIRLTPETKIDSAKTAEITAGSFTGPRLKLEPMSNWFTEGVFKRDGKLIVQFTNLGGDPWDGKLTLVSAESKIGGREWTILNPQTGEISTAEARDGALSLRLNPRETVLLVTE